MSKTKELMLRIKKNDIVMVTSGKDKGKTGKIIRVFRQECRVLVEGINLVKKHVRRTQEEPEGRDYPDREAGFRF